MKMKVFLSLAALALAGAVNAAPKIVTATNPVTGNTSIGVQSNYVAHTGGPAEVVEVQVNPMKLGIAGGPQYAISFIYVANKWLMIGDDIPANIDGRVVHFKATRGLGKRDVNPDATVAEIVTCFVKRSDLERIANASKVMAQLAGRNGSVFLTFSLANIAVFKEFLAKAR